MNTLLSSLSSISQLTDSEQLQKYTADSSGYPPALPSIVLRPANTEEVAACIKACAAAHKNYTIQGGLTGLAGGACPAEGDVVISLERMNKIEEVDTIGGTAIVQAGVVLEQLQQAVLEQGWYFPLDLGARGSCQIGGNVSTNAGGNKVFRYGTTRELVLGLEVVLPDGTVLNMLNRVIKNNTGMDLKHLFIGTEGIYGVVTRVCIRLFPKPEAVHNALVALASFEDVAQLLKEARGSLAELASFEVMWDNYLKAAAIATKRTVPFEGHYPIYVLMEVEGSAYGLQDKFVHFLERQIERGLLQDVIIPQNEEQAKNLWHIRDGVSEIFRTLQYFVAFDIGIPLKDMQTFIDEVNQAITDQYPHAVNLFFGHLGDGNLHILTGKLKQEELEAVDDLVYQLTAKYGGSITAEHGIGRIKKSFLHYSRSQEQIQLMRSIRQLINPDNLLNKGRVVD
ncbi:FAD-binding oxidoreductase [Pelistega europaea]|uniref:FAD-binding oxidoreductase n=1 Tax=Pelistega europaea TaxID=106147 RepID=A0A7Y4LAN0_9BURK|nr:FAD-binding oxidoreductase [Pelistega europaea]NOL50089.1 FAD-binding oxidoreductase [Pelistega europaea]